jgi:protein-disulfide reductase (glutathione)
MPPGCSSGVPVAKWAKPLAPAARVAHRWAEKPAQLARPWAASRTKRPAPSACYRSAPVHSSSRPRPSARARALGRFGMVVALLATTHCEVTTPYGDRRPAARGSEPGAPAQAATAPSHGFGEAIAWRHLDEGLRQAKSEGRPLMLVVHASWCSQCKALKPVFSEERLRALSEQFVMVNVDQDQTPAAFGYAPDGSYIPRVLFIDPSTGTADESLQNPRRERYHYYYGPQDDLPAMMEKALERHGKRS